MFSIFGTFARTTKRVNSEIYVKIVYEISYIILLYIFNPYTIQYMKEKRFNIEASAVIYLFYFHEFSIS